MQDLNQKNQDLEKQGTSDQLVDDKCKDFSKVMDVMYNTEVFYLYQLWNGANQFLCNGRILTGPSYKPFLVALFIILVPTIMAIILFKDQWLVTTILGCLVLYLKFRIAFSDPGIVNRLEDTFQEDELKLIPFNPSRTPYNGVCLVNTDGHSIIYRICETCRIYKNRDRRHCRECDNCVCQFDHHCIWLNNCIGKRNYTIFIGYLLVLLAHILHIIAVCIQYIVYETSKFQRILSITEKEALKKVLSHQPLSIILIIYGTVFLILLSCLLMFHCFLIVKDMTTAEFAKHKKDRDSFIPKSFFLSLKNKLRLQIAKSYINFREKIFIRTKRENQNKTPNKKNDIQGVTIDLVEINGNKDKINLEGKKSIVLKDTNNSLSQIKSLDNTLGINENSIIKCSGLLNQQTQCQSNQKMERQNRKCIEQIKDENKEDQLQTVYINQRQNFKKIKLPSINISRSKRNTNFTKCQDLSSKFQPTRSLNKLSEIQQSVIAQSIDNQIKNCLELSGIQEKSYIIQKSKKNFPSPQIQSQSNQEEGEENITIQDNNNSIQKSQPFDYNELVQISYYAENNLN